MRKIIIGSIIAILLVGGGISGYELSSYLSIEKYRLSKDDQALTSGKGRHYVADQPLSVVAVSKGKQIGRTENFGAVYEIKGQPQHDWVVFNQQSEMSFDQVYHLKKVKPFSPLDQRIQTVRMMENAGIKQALGMSIAATKNRAMLQELAETISKKRKMEKVKSEQIFSLQMTFREYKGLAYVYYAMITDHKKVYLSEVNDNRLIQASPLVSKWVLQHAPHK